MHDTQKATEAYRQAVELDSSNPEGWNRLGHLLVRSGELEEAETAYRKVLDLAEAASEQGWLSASYGNLGNVFRTRGDLDQAEQMYERSLGLLEEIGAISKAEMVQRLLEELREDDNASS